MNKKDNRTYLEFNEIADFFYKSWVFAYKHLGWLIKNEKSTSSFIYIYV